MKCKNKNYVAHLQHFINNGFNNYDAVYNQ